MPVVFQQTILPNGMEVIGRHWEVVPMPVIPECVVSPFIKENYTLVAILLMLMVSVPIILQSGMEIPGHRLEAEWEELFIITFSV